MNRARFLAFLLLLAPLPGRGQDVALRDAFLQAKGLWSNQGDRDGAAARFEQVIAALEPKSRELPQEWRRTLCEAYNWLAVLDDRSAANKTRAARNLEAALDLDPDFDIDRGITPSRLQAIFDGLRSTKLVKIRISYQPDGGSLTLDDRPTAVQAEKYLPVGAHTFRYRKPGFAIAELPLAVVAGSSPSLDIRLQRISSTVKLYVSPPGTEVFLDGRSRGRVEGSAGAEVLPLAEKAGIKIETLGGPFLLTELAVGEHLLELKAPCHRPKKITLPKDYSQPFQDLTLEPYALEPSLGSLALASDWGGGEVFLDGARKGTLPLPPLPICAGSYALEVRFPNGGFTRAIVVEDGKTLALEVKPKPRLAYLGVQGEDDFTGKARLQTQLLSLGERLETVAFLPRAGTDPPQALLASLKAAKEAELFLHVEVRKDGPVHQMELVLSTPENEEERIPVKALEADPLGMFVARLNRPPILQVPWCGISLVDLPDQPGPWVLQAEPAAVQAGVRVLQPILRVDDRPVADLAEFRLALRQSKATTIRIGQTQGTFAVPLVQAPVEVPLADPALSYPFLLADLRLRLLAAKGEASSLLRFQLALALMHFRKFERAAELLRDIRLPGGPGVGQGTVEYYIGLCLLRLGAAYIPEAIQAFSQALGHPAATLFGPQGPLVAPLAKQAIEDQKLN